MIPPPALTANSRIGVISPSYWLAPEMIQKATSVFQGRGYHLSFGKTCYLKEGPFAGSPKERANDIHLMFENPEIDAIICARGGYGSNHVLPLLDYELIKSKPKIFMGYSDITGLLTSITQQTGMITFHGPMFTTFKEGMVDYNFHIMESVLSGEPTVANTSPKELHARTLKSGSGQGALWGGNMTLIIDRLGTPDQLMTEGSILFLEDLDEPLYSYDRMLTHMRNTGMFDHIHGLIIGELLNIKNEEIPFGKTVDEIVLDICGDLDIPIVTNFPCGHGRFQATMPLSLPVKLVANSSEITLTLLESPVRKD